MRILRKTAAVIVGVVLIAFVAAAILIPAKKSFTQEMEINAPREIVWEVLNDRDKYAEWQDQLTGIEIKDDRHWTETTVDGQLLEMTLVSAEQPSSMRLSYKIGENFKGAWHGELREVSRDKTIIRTTDSTEIDSPIMKVTVAMFFDIEEFAKGWNLKLKDRAESIHAKRK